jgi:hypothetical protein
LPKFFSILLNDTDAMMVPVQEIRFIQSAVRRVGRISS